MNKRRFIEDLQQYGPQSDSKDVSLEEAFTYCRQLAAAHYENFSVASWLLPKNLRQHFCNVYAYCRWADDLADEVEARDDRLALLAWWRESLLECFAGQARHPVFVALKVTIDEFDIPEEPFRALLEAFVRDQHQVRYETHDELLEYCRCSANPVGHLVLYLGHSYSDSNAKLSDSICTGLQLANFAQDVAEDFDRGRIYLPRESCIVFGYGEECFEQRIVDECWRSLLRSEVDLAADYLQSGWPLLHELPRELRFQVELFLRGGFAILQAIRRQDYDVWTTRPTVGKLTQVKLAARSWLRQRVMATDRSRITDDKSTR